MGMVTLALFGIGAYFAVKKMDRQGRARKSSAPILQPQAPAPPQYAMVATPGYISGPYAPSGGAAPILAKTVAIDPETPSELPYLTKKDVSQVYQVGANESGSGIPPCVPKGTQITVDTCPSGSSRIYSAIGILCPPGQEAAYASQASPCRSTPQIMQSADYVDFIMKSTRPPGAMDRKAYPVEKQCPSGYEPSGKGCWTSDIWEQVGGLWTVTGQSTSVCKMLSPHKYECRRPGLKARRRDA